MKCKHCNGKGRILEPFGNRTIPAGCPICGGTGEVEITEQEYIQTCNTEQLADFLDRISDFCEMCEKHCDNDTGMQCNGDFKGHWGGVVKTTTHYKGVAEWVI